VGELSSSPQRNQKQRVLEKGQSKITLLFKPRHNLMEDQGGENRRHEDLTINGQTMGRKREMGYWKQRLKAKRVR